jgi:hypothetical protein
MADPHRRKWMEPARTILMSWHGTSSRVMLVGSFDGKRTRKTKSVRGSGFRVLESSSERLRAQQ